MPAKRQASIDYFAQRVETLEPGQPAQVGVSGLWEVAVEVVLVPMLRAVATHPVKPPVVFMSQEAKDLAWKLIGVQINMRPFQWDQASGD